MKDIAKAIEDVPALSCDKAGPVFREPWEAQAFALAVGLSDLGYFKWSEWVEIFSQQITTARENGDPDLGDTYYHHWLNALERICAEKGLVGRVDMHRRKDEWRRAYLNTPHGRPIELKAAFKDDGCGASDD